MSTRCGRWMRWCRTSLKESEWSWGDDESECETTRYISTDKPILPKDAPVMRVLLLGPTLSGKSSFLASVLEGGDFLGACVAPTRGFLYNTELCEPFQNRLTVAELGGTSNPTLLTISGPYLADAVGLFFDGSSSTSIDTMLQTWWKEASNVLEHAKAAGNQPFLFVVESHVDRPTPAHLAQIQDHARQHANAPFLYTAFQADNSERCRVMWHVLLRQFEEQCKTLPPSSSV